MTMYRYRALDPEGAPVEGNMEAVSAHAVTRKLQERGLTVNGVEEAYPDRRLLRESPRGTICTSDGAAGLRRAGRVAALGPLKALASELRIRVAPGAGALHADWAARRWTALSIGSTTAFRELPALVRAGEASGNLPGCWR